MSDEYALVIPKGADFDVIIGIGAWPSGFPALNTATEWRLTLFTLDQASLLVVSSTGVSPMITLNIAQTQGTVLIPAAATALLPTGAALYNLDIFFPSAIKRILGLEPVQVNP